LKPGEIGELQGRGPMVMQGYYNKPEDTAETIIDGGWLRSGDLASLTADGHLVIAGGRLRDMIIRGGENIYPAEIENVLQTHDAVSGVAVFGMPDDYYGEIVAAAVKLSGVVSAADLQALCAARIAKFKCPAILYRVDAFPLTPSGKIRKVELRARAGENRMDRLP
jgi:fatty-acyl-CoA synthase